MKRKDTTKLIYIRMLLVGLPVGKFPTLYYKNRGICGIKYYKLVK